MATSSTGAPAPTGGNAFISAINALSTLAGWVSAAMVVAAVIITCQMIVIRFVLNGSTVWHTEAVIYLVIGATMIGLSYVQRLRGHVNVDLFPLKMKGKARRWLAIIVLLASIAMIGVMTWHAYEFWRFAFDRGWKSDTVWGVRLWIPYLAMPVGLGLLLLQLVADFVSLIKGYDTPFGLGEN